MLAVIFITRTAMGLMFQSLAAVGPFLIDDLRLTYFHYSLLLGLFLLPGGVMALPGECSVSASGAGTSRARASR